jgi:two-component system phosphate regulon sensor histidine kinase PhoR
MVEGVLAVDDEKRLIKINESAAGLFQVDAARACGNSIEEVIRNTDLQAVIRDSLRSREPVEGDIHVPEGDRHLQAHGTVLHGATGGSLGAVIVLNDITHLRRLETMRRDFVANVSHELKTPITSIKGFAETLIDGAAGNKDELHRFLEIIGRQADRLQSILEDLLVLSSIEHGTENNDIELQEGRLINVLEGAARAGRSAAEKRNMTVQVTCGKDLKANMNIQLMEQAVINLVDNAVKYGTEDTTVEMIGESAGDEVAIHVVDHGPGIPRKHLGRVFERFYRVDKSRSRKLGGTGLGLAIVNRVAIAHQGRAVAESEVGKGSRFSIYLPALTDA